ncbi:transglutaminase [candidate division LCP-89 bacterium B3_LCP]|uniref:Transglutaminase n=1 Tax=candidate division LCP-89 bacterium B3_LCP TaxID=2012998 RepID=A0A532V3Z4_UNCL8|nr:MAG: transglutaminase [candidate division LCP-89 bacterium B3_LCP]
MRRAKTMNYLRMLFICLCIVIQFAFAAALAAVGDVTAAFPAPGTCPTGLSWDGKRLWVSDLKTDTLYAIDRTDGTVTDKIAAPTFRPLGLAFDGEGLWCVCGEEELLYRIIPKTSLVTHRLESPVEKPTGLAWDGKYIWVASRKAREIHQIDPEDGTTINSFPSPARYPQGLAFDGKYLWVADRVSDKIYLVNPTGGEVIAMFDAPAPYAYGLAWDGEKLWNADFQSDSIYCLSVGGDDAFIRKEGKKQRVEFTHEVRNYGPGIMESLDVYIAIPENLPNQELLGKPVFSPEPTGFLKDRWGQKVAHYHFTDSPAGTINKVSMTVEAEIWDTRWFIFPDKVGALDDIPADIRKEYLEDDDKFSLDHPTIQKAVTEAVGDETNPYWRMRRIFNYVIDNIYYEMSGGWNTAPAVLERGNGSCSEYTFVFIAICRAAGLPARYAGSIAIRGDDASLDDVFHRWAEVYLPNYGWIPVDASRGDSASPEHQADSIGHLTNTYIITTRGGGNSEYLGWTYNSDEKWVTRGKCKIYTEHIGEWNPIGGE